jgi:methionine sulfoxide reductase heme-binding subunit
MTQRRIVMLKIAVWALCLTPLGILVYDGFHAQLGANPIERIMNDLGFYTLVLLMTSLAVTPLRRLTGLNWLIRFRRLLGLFAFFYVFLHFATYVALDQEFSLDAIFTDIAKRPFITVGFLAFVLLIPLAATSTSWSIRKLGGKNWNRLHKLVYFSAGAGVVHFWWKVKADYFEPNTFAAILAVLIGYRLVIWATNRRTASTAAAPASGRS